MVCSYNLIPGWSVVRAIESVWIYSELSSGFMIKKATAPRIGIPRMMSAQIALGVAGKFFL